MKVLIATILSFGLYFILQQFFFRQIIQSVLEVIDVYPISYLIAYTLIGTPVFIATLIIHQPKSFLGIMGLKRNVLTALLFAILCVLPMLIGYSFVFKFNSGITLKNIVVGVIAAAFFEELYFRGFLFGQLFRFTKLGFVLSLMIPSVIFASAHLYQSHEISTIVGIFITTFFGSALFAWTYIEWDNNLWIPIFLHLLMNLSWMLFAAGDNAFGGLYANIFRVLTIGTVVLGTILYKKKKQRALAVNRHTLW